MEIPMVSKVEKASEALALIRAHNKKFFDGPTMRFFGKQKIKCVPSFGRWVLKVEYLEKCPRVTYFSVDNHTWEIKGTIK